MPSQLILAKVMISPIGEMVTYALTQLTLATVMISPIGEMVTYAYTANTGTSHNLANWRNVGLCLLS